MNKQKLISVLQSRIASRQVYLAEGWEYYNEIHPSSTEKKYIKDLLISTGQLQKEDKAILRQLILDEREIKDWKREFNRSLETNRSLEVKMRNYKITGHFLIRGMAN